MMNKLLLVVFCSFAFGFTISAQSDTLKPPKPNVQSGITFIGSFPQNDFLSTDLQNADAGFANTGLGGGVFISFKYRSGFFLELVADYRVRNSSVIKNAVEVLNSNEEDNLAYLTNEELRYRQLSFMIGPGYEFGKGTIRPFINLRFGLTRTVMTEASIKDSNNDITNFAQSGQAVGSIGICAGVNVGEKVKLELAYQNFGTPEFQPQPFDSDTEFSLPIQVLEIKIGITLLRKENS